MLAIKTDNPEIENRLKQYAIQHKKAVEELVSDALKMFLDINKTVTDDSRFNAISIDTRSYKFNRDDANAR